MASTAVTEKPKNTLEALLLKHQDSFKAVLPSQIDPTRMLRIMLSAIRATPGLLNCEAMSVLGALMQSAQLGLEPNTPQGHAYLIPYGKECTFILGYKGMAELAYRSDRVASVAAHVVYEKDNFDINYGTEESIYHKPLLEGDRGEMIGAYAVVKLHNGGIIQRFLRKDEILAARPKHWLKTPWNDSNPYVVAECSTS